MTSASPQETRVTGHSTSPLIARGVAITAAIAKNLVALLVAPAAVGLSDLSGTPNNWRFVIAAVAAVVAIGAVILSSKRGVAIAGHDEPNPGLDGLPGNPGWDERHATSRTAALEELELEHAARDQSHRDS